MTATDGVLEIIPVEFELACLDLAQARSVQSGKDSPTSRARVQACRERVDALLDLWNATRRVPS